ncbi:MAG: sugar ABC transporter substrate-binding protein [Candidatus Melainabacteria bacterium]|nr:sugar ABC transporter substrate-binding protein [Candidatus Melainabacteria bacterium]
MSGYGRWGLWAVFARCQVGLPKCGVWLCLAGLLLGVWLAGAGCAFYQQKQLSGQSSGGRLVSPRVSLQLATWGNAEETRVLRNLLNDFEAQNPSIAVELLHIPENYYQKIHLLIAADMTPDVMLTNSLSFPVYAAHGVFADLSPYLARLQTPQRGNAVLQQSVFYPQALAAFHWKTKSGHQLLGALPRDVSNLVLFYNKDWFAREGVPDPQQLWRQGRWTWTAFLSAAQALTHLKETPSRFGVSFYRQPPLFWLPFVWSAGGDLFNASRTQLTLAQPKALAGLQFYSDLRNRYHVAPRQVESGSATMSQLFVQQRLAMLVSGRWSVPVFREQALFNWDVVPLPTGPAGVSRVGVDASGYAMAAKTPHPEAAWKLIAHLTSRQAVAQFAESGLIVPARQDVAEQAAFLDPRQPPANSRAFLQVITTGVPSQTPPRWNEVSETLGLALEPVWDGKQTVAEAIGQLTPTINALLNEGQADE